MNVKGNKKAVVIAATPTTKEQQPQQTIKSAQKDISSFFKKKTIEPSPKTIVSCPPVITPNEKTELPIEGTASDSKLIDLSQSSPKKNEITVHPIHVVTAEKTDLPESAEPLPIIHNTNSRESRSSSGSDHHQFSPSEHTISSISVSVRDGEAPSSYGIERRNATISGQSSLFPILEVDMGIDRLVSSPSPLRSASADLVAIKEEEISSFFISSPSATNVSLDPSLKLFHADGTIQQNSSSSSRPGISMPSLAEIHGSSNQPGYSDMKQSEETEKRTFSELVVSPTSNINSNEHADSNRQSGRKRKPIDAFDPTPSTRPRKSKAKKVSEKTLDSHVIVLDGTNNVAPMIISDAKEEKIEPVVIDEEYVPGQDVAKSTSKKQAKTPAKPRKTSKTPTTETGAHTATGSIATTPVPTPPLPALPEEMKMKVDQILEKMNILATEVSVFEGKLDYNDQELELDNEKLRADILSVLIDPLSFYVHFVPTSITPAVTAAASSSTGISNEGIVAIEKSEEMTEKSPTEEQPHSDAVSEAATSSDKVSLTIHEASKLIVQIVIIRTIQGSGLTLSQLTDKVQIKLQQLLAWSSTIEIDSSENRNTFIDELTRWCPQSLSSSSPAATSSLLVSYIPTVAIRECYGYRQKNTLLFEDESAIGVYRWEAHSMQFFNKSSQFIIREVRSVRNRYSRAIKAMVKVIEQIHKSPLDSSKLPPLEEKVAKCYSEIEKAKEKRREYEQKKALEMEEKQKKQEQLEKKKKEKEEIELKKKQQQEALAQAKATMLADKEKQKQEKLQKTAQVLEKQKSLFMNFLHKNPSSNTPSSSSFDGNEESSKLMDVVVDISAGNDLAISSVSTSSPIVPSVSSNLGSIGPLKKIPKPVTIDLHAEEEKFTAFMQDLHGNKSFAEISRLRRQLQEKKRLFSSTQGKSIQKTARRPKTIKIMVYTSASTGQRTSAFAAEEEEYSELSERYVSNKMKTFLFQEDFRPAYVGTFSKRSTLITGRRPFAKDFEYLNYDYDSEEEWEEEVEGENIEESGGEEDDELDEEAKNATDLVYDEFFRQDNDFGSDMDSDGEEIAAVVMPNFARIKEEILGLRYIDHVMIQNNSIREGFSSSSLNTPSTNCTPQQPILLKVEAANKSGKSSSLFAFKHHSGDSELSLLEEPQLLVLTNEEEEKKRNMPKKKKKIPTTSVDAAAAPNVSIETATANPENAGTTSTVEEKKTKTPKKRKPKIVEGEKASGAGEVTSQIEEIEGAAKPKKQRKSTPKKKPVEGAVEKDTNNSSSAEPVASSVEPKSETEHLPTAPVSKKDSEKEKSVKPRKRANKGAASAATPATQKKNKTITEAFSAVKSMTFPSPNPLFVEIVAHIQPIVVDEVITEVKENFDSNQKSLTSPKVTSEQFTEEKFAVTALLSPPVAANREGKELTEQFLSPLSVEGGEASVASHVNNSPNNSSSNPPPVKNRPKKRVTPQIISPLNP